MPIAGLDLTDAQIFQGLNLVLPAWLLLILLPRWKFTHSFAIFTAVGFSILYTLLFITMLLQPVGDFSFDKFFTYEGVKEALSSPEVVLPAWVHYVAFDLFTAKWLVSQPFPVISSWDQKPLYWNDSRAQENSLSFRFLKI